MPEAGLTDAGALLATTHEASGGLRVRLRLARPSDALRVRSFLEGLAPETRRARFPAYAGTVPDALVRRFTFQNPRERLVLAATAPLDGGERVVGLADVALTATGVADLGVVVDDNAQNRGVGKLLTEAIASLAIQQGATHLRAELPDGESPVVRLMERLGRTVRTVEDDVQVAHTKLPASRRRAA